MMQFKYSFFHVSIYIFGLAAISESVSIAEQMNTLLAAPILKSTAKSVQTPGTLQGELNRQLGEMIEPDEEGYIVNEFNVSEKIPQYFTMLSFFYSDRLYQLCFYFRYVHVSFMNLQLDRKIIFRLLRQQMRDFGPMLTKMKSSLELIKKMAWDCGQPIENVEIISAIDSIYNGNDVVSDNLTDFMSNVVQFNEFIETFIVENRPAGVVGTRCKLPDNTVQRLVRIVDTAFGRGPPLQSVQLNLQDYIHKRLEAFEKYFKCYGFGYSDGSAYVHIDTLLGTLLTDPKRVHITVTLVFPNGENVNFNIM